MRISFFALFFLVVGTDDGFYKAVAHYVFFVEFDMGDAVYIAQDANGFFEAAALVALGAATARFTARPPWRGAAEQLALGAAAAAITYGVGSAFGVGLS